MGKSKAQRLRAQRLGGEEKSQAKGQKKVE
jgi:hypothetical protein